MTQLSVKRPAAELGVVGEAEELPLGERLGHREFDLHLAVGVGEQMREEEGRLVEVLSRGDLAQVGPRAEAAAPWPGLAACLFCSSRPSAIFSIAAVGGQLGAVV